MLAILSLLFATATTVLGHGFVQEVVVSSGTYTGYLPYNDPYANPAPQRIIRKIPGNGPIEDVTSSDIQCNGGAVPAPMVAKVAAGSNVAMNWTTWPDSHIGPVITYMARAPSDVTKWNPGTSAVWFKVDERGLMNGKWAATDILTGENKSVWTFKVPASLKAGQYIIRHEIIALHSAGQERGAQFYPSCIQVDVTGSGTETGPSQLVAFPGAYKSTDPGILFDAYKGATTYVIPGPAVWTGGSSGGAAAAAPAPATKAQSTSASARPATTAATQATSAPTSGTVAQFGQCGGSTYTGPTACAAPYTCKRNNDYYSQCL